MKKGFYLLGIMAIMLVLTASLAWAAPGGVTDPAALKDLATVRETTAKYHDVNVALADGYVSTVECVEVPGLGGMGIHYVNFGLLGDLQVDPLAPEVLLYVPSDEGLKLVAVEYLMTALANTPSGPMPWFEHDPPPDGFVTTPPALFGQTFNGPMAGHGPGEPWHYELHTWVWQANPVGIFADFNPNVSCS
jgi:hypothetical protein